jgi:hypothetical protein
MAFTIDLTARGVLLAARWRTEGVLNRMNADETRNTLIELLTRHTKQPVEYFQGLQDDDLVGKGAVVAFLREAGVAGKYQFQNMTDDDERNNLIWQCHENTDYSVAFLQGKTSKELIPIALDWLNRSRAGSRTWHPRSPLAEAVYHAGFLYDPVQDIIYSRMDAHQRKFGYAYGYDELAFLISAEIDCEPIFFNYNGKAWMIEFWKGQYGLMTGCEIGVYNRSLTHSPAHYHLLDAIIGKRPHDTNPTHNLFFDCAGDDELLEMEFTLYTGHGKLFSRGPERHWWLTGFKWGELRSPDELTMIGKIKFPSQVMLDAFYDAMRNLGYAENPASLRRDNHELSVEFTFNWPRTTWQPRKDPARQPVYTKVREVNRGVISQYKQLGLPSNNPNLPRPITADQVRMVTDAITKHGEDFFLQAVADLSKKANLTAEEAMNAMVHGLKAAYDEASQAVRRAFHI